VWPKAHSWQPLERTQAWTCRLFCYKFPKTLGPHASKTVGLLCMASGVSKWPYVFCHLPLARDPHFSSFWSPPLPSQVFLLLSPWPLVCCGCGCSWCVATQGHTTRSPWRLEGPCAAMVGLPSVCLTLGPVLPTKLLHPLGLFPAPCRTFF
jgi:hypothetical protein